jgi:hypothetical protein
VSTIQSLQFGRREKLGQRALAQLRELLNHSKEVGLLIDELPEYPLLYPDVLLSTQRSKPAVLSGYHAVWSHVLPLPFHQDAHASVYPPGPHLLDSKFLQDSLDGLLGSLECYFFIYGYLLGVFGTITGTQSAFH